MAAPNLSPGRSLGKFRLVEELGEGGMGIVYRAYDTQLQRDVAIKILNARALGDSKARQRFRNEALILSRLNHPNVECVYEFRSEEDLDFLVLEYVPGTTLNEVVRNGHLCEQDVISLGIQLARGLAAAHGQRVLHRDLKPGNLRVTPDNVLKILDFGLAQLMALSDDRTLDTDDVVPQNPLAGTPAYLSPEQLHGVDPDVRSDIYSAGVVLYELATGCKPFPQAGQLLIDTILHGVPPAPRLKNKEITPVLEAVILRCLEKDPKARYQSARELQIDLERLSTEHHPSGPSLAYPRGPAAADTLRRNLVIAAALLVTVVVAAYFVWRGTHPKPQQQKVMAVLPMDTVGQDPATSALGLGLTETVAAKLVQASDASPIQVVSPQDLRDQKVKTAEDAQRIFGTDYVLESSMQRSGNAIRINCYLVDSKTHRQIAAKTIEAQVTDAFVLQDKVVTAALTMLPSNVKPGQRNTYNAVQNTDPAAYEAYLRGRGYRLEYEKPENIENAITEFRQAIAIDPNYAPAYAGLGDAYRLEYLRMDKGNEVLAMGSQNCQKALSLDSELVEAHVCLANILNGSGKYAEAVQEFQRALQSNSANYAALKGLADAYRQSGDLLSAESTYKKVVALWSSYWSAYDALGYFYFAQARYAEAATTFLKATELAPDNYQSYIYLGGSYIALGRYEEAITASQRSIELRPNSDALTNLGYTYYLMHRYPDAIAAHQKAISLNDNYWENWGNLGDALYWSSNGKSKALASYHKAIDLATAKLQINPQDADVLPYIANYYAMLDDNQTSMHYLHEALKAAPSNPEVLFRAAIIYNRFGERERAFSYLRQALSLGYSPSIIRDSPDLQSLQIDKQFRGLLDNASQR